MTIESNIKPMKFLITCIIIICSILPNLTFAQVKPTAEVISEDVTICESGEVDFTVRLTGTPPFVIAYQFDGSTFTEDPSYETTKSYTLTFNKETKSDVILKAVYDSNYPYINSSSESGNIIGDGEITVTVDEMPVVSAGSDDDICGFEYELNGTITGSTTKVWWSGHGSSGNFDDDTSPTAQFTGNTADVYTLTLNAENGSCSASDDVEITLKGRPTGTFSNAENWNYCSTDAPSHELPVEIDFTGTGDFKYILKNNEETPTTFGPFTTSNLRASQNIPVSNTQTISLHSITDGQGCVAEAEDMLGSRTATDVKPIIDIGDYDDFYCGPEVTLKATISSGTTGKWTSETSGISFNDDTKYNSIVTASFSENETYKDATLRWTETTTDEYNCEDHNEVDIKFVQKPTFALSSSTSDEICDGESAFAEYTLKGTTPLSVKYRDENNTYSKDDINLLTGALELTPPFDVNEQVSSITEYTITKISDQFNCSTPMDQSYTVTIDEMPVANAGPNDKVCGTEVKLSAIPYFEDGEWILNKGTFIDTSDPETNFIANHSGSFLYLTWKETNGLCSDIDSVKITFSDAPETDLKWSDNTIYALQSIELPAKVSGETTGKWSIIEPSITGASIMEASNPTSIFSNLSPNENYHLQWKATLESAPIECRDTIYDVHLETKPLLTPTGISPKSSLGSNDLLEIRGAENISNNKLSVFDKHGKLIFTTNDYGTKSGDNEDPNYWPNTDLGHEIPAPGIYLYVFEGDGISPVKNYLVIKY